MRPPRSPSFILIGWPRLRNQGRNIALHVITASVRVVDCSVSFADMPAAAPKSIIGQAHFFSSARSLRCGRVVVNVMLVFFFWECCD